MYKAWKKASVSLIAIAALVFLFAPAALAQQRAPAKESVAWGIPVNDIVGMDVKAQHGEMVGTVEDMTLTRAGRIRDVIVGLEGTDRAVAVPMRDIGFTDQNYVMYKGTKADLDKMTPVAYYNAGAAPARGYYAESDHAFFRPESYFHPYKFSQPEQRSYSERGYYSEQPESSSKHEGTYYGYDDTRLPRTPYTSPKRWLP